MGVKLADLTADRRKVAIPLNMGENPDTGEQNVQDLNVVYRPSAYTANTEKELNVLRQSDWKSEMGLTFLTTLVVSWDLEEDDGTPYIITKESLASLPSTFISQVMAGIAGDMGKAAARSNDS